MGVAEAFEWYADWAREEADAPLYARLAEGVTEDPDLLDLTEARHPGQPAPQLLFGAVHDRLLDGVEHRLQNWYPTCVDEPLSPAETDPMPAFRDFCLSTAEQLRDIIATRYVSTNAVGRSAILYPAFARISDTATEPLAILEIGASAGLNLLWDQYRYRYDGQECGRADAAVTIESRIHHGAPPLPASPSRVAYRLGIDLHPPDLTDSADTRWLRALVLPEHRDRFERLTAAIDAARDAPPDVLKGDSAAQLGELLDRFPEDGTPCVFSTHVRYQMDDADISAADSQIREWSETHDRQIHSLYTDNHAESPGNGYRHVVFDRGEVRSNDLIGAYESYGRWIEWYDDS